MVGVGLLSAVSAAETFENGVETQGKSKVSVTLPDAKEKVVLEKTEAGFCLNEDGKPWLVTYVSDPAYLMGDFRIIAAQISYYPDGGQLRKATALLFVDGRHASCSHNDEDLQKMGIPLSFWTWFDLPAMVEAMKSLAPEWENPAASGR